MAFQSRARTHLQVSERCVQACGPAFHEQLAISQFFDRIRQAIVEPDSAQVRLQLVQYAMPASAPSLFQF